MDTEIQATHRALKELRVNGKIAELVRARKGHKCDECGFPIEPRSYYYCIYLAGSGLGNLKFPDRVHEECLTNYLNTGGKHG